MPVSDIRDSSLVDFVTEKIPITAIVVTLNESRRLKACLDSLSFFRQVLVFDLGSTDSSTAIARQQGATVRNYPHRPVIEQIHAEVVEFADYDWLILIDPDEVWPIHRTDELVQIIATRHDIGMVQIPWQFYFKGRPLKGTAWGGIRFKGAVVHRRRVHFRPMVHRGIAVKSGYRSVRWPYGGDNCIRHYWVDRIGVMFAKHWRYIQNEGPARYFAGERFSFWQLASTIYHSLKANTRENSAARDGLLGYALCLFYLGYTSLSIFSLALYQLRMHLDKRISADSVQDRLF